MKTDETPLEPKEMVACNKCDGYLKEIESLKKTLSERDQEISMLHKLIVSQARKQSGLWSYLFSTDLNKGFRSVSNAAESQAWNDGSAIVFLWIKWPTGDYQQIL